MKKIALSLAVVAAAFVAVPAFADDFDFNVGDDDDDGPVLLAQNGPNGGPNGGGAGGVGGLGRRGGGGGSDDARGALRERVKAKIQTYLTVELAQRAGLDEKKSLQLGNAIKAHMERKQKAREAKKTELQKLRSLVDGKGADSAVKAQLQALLNSSDRDDQVQAFVDDTSKFLTPTEQAKLVLALPEVMKDTRQLVREARQERRGGAGGRGRFRGQE